MNISHVKTIEELLPKIMHFVVDNKVITHEPIIVAQYRLDYFASNDESFKFSFYGWLNSEVGTWVAKHKIGPFRLLKDIDYNSLLTRYHISATMTSAAATYYRLKYG